nr:hypothetical protein [Azospirillum sp. 412522]
MLIGVYFLTMQLPPEPIGSAKDVEFLLIPDLAAVGPAFRHTTRRPNCPA